MMPKKLTDFLNERLSPQRRFSDNTSQLILDFIMQNSKVFEICDSCFECRFHCKINQNDTFCALTDDKIIHNSVVVFDLMKQKCLDSCPKAKRAIIILEE